MNMIPQWVDPTRPRARMILAEHVSGSQSMSIGPQLLSDGRLDPLAPLTHKPVRAALKGGTGDDSWILERPISSN